MDQQSTSLKERVSHAYWKYGRFCSSHPLMTLSTSIATIIFLSSPIVRLQLPASAPFETFLASNHSGLNIPDWYKKAEPFGYIQQIIVMASVSEQKSSKSRSISSDWIKVPLSLSFDVHNKVAKLLASSPDVCLSVGKAKREFLPQSCLLLSPSLLWKNAKSELLNDPNVLNTIFDSDCNSEVCYKLLNFGVPVKMTGLNRHRRVHPGLNQVNFALTLVLNADDFRTPLKEMLKDQYELVLSPEDNPTAEMNVFYKSRKKWTDYIPLVLSYGVLLIYVYFSVSKIEMVKSKWGLAFSAVFTVASSLVMTAGICIQFDLTPMLWGGELFPYLAMIVGLENTLCITRSVVSTPVSLDVRSRISHGLSKEGWSITKNFLTEWGIITVGFITFVPEIQEFCTFTCIGLVTDFYMQLFFYSPILTFDLLRIDSQYKEELSALQANRNSSTEVAAYPSAICPFAKVMPSWFEKPRTLPADKDNSTTDTPNTFNSLSSRTDELKTERKISTEFSRQHRRAISDTSALWIKLDESGSSALQQFPVPKRLRFLGFWAKTRVIQRFVMLLTVLWIVWLSVMVHELKVMQNIRSVFGAQEGENNSTDKPNSLRQPEIIADLTSRLTGAYENSFDPPAGDTVTLERQFVDPTFGWQRRTFKWWPTLFSLYNTSVSNRYVTFLPPIVIRAKVEADEFLQWSSKSKPTTSYQPLQVEQTGFFHSPELKMRISWLELQMTIVLAVSVGIFAVVAIFIVYVCFVGGRTPQCVDGSKTGTDGHSFKTHRRVGSKAIVEAVPIVFSGHKSPVEQIRYGGGNLILSTSVSGEMFVFDIRNGDFVRQIGGTTRQRPTVSGSNQGSEGLRHRGLQQQQEPKESKSEDTAEMSFTKVSAKGRVWSVAMQSGVVAVGYSTGKIELWDAITGLQRAAYQSEVTDGITHLVLKGSRVVAGHLRGILEFLELRNASQSGAATGQPPTTTLNVLFTLIRNVSAHQHPINDLKCTSNQAITASVDRTLKTFDLSTGRPQFTLYGHNSPVASFVVDESLQCAYSCCNEGIICFWDLMDGSLMRTITGASQSRGPVTLALSPSLLVGQSTDGLLWLWKRNTGDLITQIKICKDSVSPAFSAVQSNVAVIADSIAVCNCDGGVQFWDLNLKMLLREVKLDEMRSEVVGIAILDPTSVVCAAGNYLYRINFPMIKCQT